jgi:predicted NUDIX family phosphoesterase
MLKEDQLIACFPVNVLDGTKIKGCVTVFQHGAVMEKLFGHTVYMRRGDIEQDPSWLQIIPYTYVYNKRGEIFTYRRRPVSGETRLHGKVSVGVGGHVEQGDNRVSPQAAVLAAAYRELHEELLFDPLLGPTSTLFHGFFLRLQGTPVDQVHFGMVMSLAYSGTIQANDGEIEVVGWLKPAAILELKEVEEWTKELLTYIMQRDAKGCNC